MTWVMVPVPEELAPQVEVLLIQLRFRAEVPQWDESLMSDHLASLAEEPRAVLSTVAARVIAGSPIEDVQLAEQLQVSVREVFGLVRDANDVTVGASPGDLLYSRQDEVDDGAGGTRRRRVLYMLEGLAEMVRDHEAAVGQRRPTSPAV